MRETERQGYIQVHVLSSKHSYRPMRARIVAQLFYVGSFVSDFVPMQGNRAPVLLYFVELFPWLWPISAQKTISNDTKI